MGTFGKLITVIHDSEEHNFAVFRVLRTLGYKRSFVRDGLSVDLPDNLFIRQTKGEDVQAIRDRALGEITDALNEQEIPHGKLGVFVGEDWTSVVSVEDTDSWLMEKRLAK